MTTTTIVVPCFDEAHRLDAQALVELGRLACARVLVVDDGSTDGTAERVMAVVESCPHQVRLLRLDRNHGKGEAVRRGLLAALDGGDEIVGYYDADLATPPAEMARLVEELRARPELSVVLGARVALLGSRIERSAPRHYLGRGFATVASLVLGMTVYDTQCGAKVFRVGPALSAALAQPFHSRWAFDVELLGRLRRGGGGVPALSIEAFREEPLASWSDPGKSKLRPGGAVRAALDLGRVWMALRRQ